MDHPIRGLHHVTATVDDAQQDFDFCMDLLGLRLAKTTVKSFAAPQGSLPFWRARLEQRGVHVRDATSRFGDEAIAFRDPSGLVLELVAAADERTPWVAGNVGDAHAVRGLHSVTLTVESPARTVALLERRVSHRTCCRFWRV